MTRSHPTPKAWAALTSLALMGHMVLAMADTPVNTNLREERWTVPAQQSGTRRVTLEATVEAVRQAVLSTQVPGAIVSLSVKAGDRVRSGQELLRVDARAAQQQVLGSNAQLQAAQAQLKVAALDLNRQKQLFDRQFISQGAMDKSQMEYDAAKAQVDAMQAQNKAAQVQTGFYVVHAPYDGIVNDVPVVLGDMAMPGRPLVVMYAPGQMRLSASVPQSLLPWAKDARSIQYDIEGVTSQPLNAGTSELLPSADPLTRTLTLRLSLPQGLNLLAPGMAAKVHLLGAQPQGEGRIWIPARALIQRAELNAVRVVNAQGGISLKQVRVGERYTDQIEILSGLRPGEQVLMPSQSLKNSQE